MKSGHTIQLLLSWMITWISAKFQALGMLLLCLLFLMLCSLIISQECLPAVKKGLTTLTMFLMDGVLKKDFGELSKKPDAGWLLPVLFP